MDLLNRKKVFLSSTVEDLKDLRNGIVELVVEEFGFEVIDTKNSRFIHSNKYSPYENCLLAVNDCDIYVLVIDKIYGNFTGKSQKNKFNKIKFTDYNSITRDEFRTAIEKDKKILVFVRHEVLKEFELFDNFTKGKSLSFNEIFNDFYISLNRKPLVQNEFVFSFLKELFDRRRSLDNKVKWRIPFESLKDLKESLREQLIGLLDKENRLPYFFKNPNFINYSNNIENIIDNSGEYRNRNRN